jgi:cobalt-zinc-cadmium efflux system outer membrane protein
MQRAISYLVIVLVALSSVSFTDAQSTAFQKDTLQLPLDSAENIFLQNNLLLLAQKYNIDAAKALIIQAKLYPNPNISFSSVFYQTQTKKILPVGSDGEIQSSISQMILLARKRNKQIKIAETNAKLAEYQFFDLLRTLKYTLRLDFFNIYYLRQSAKVYDKEIQALQQVVNAFEQQKGKGYISEKEVVRIKAQLYSFQSEYNDLINQINDTQSELRLVLQVKNFYIEPLVDSNKIATLNPSSYSLAVLIDSAYQARTDLKIAKATTDLSKQSYDLQKAMAIPDLNVQMGYDQQGSYIKNLNTVGVGIDIPIFNRNQGNIKSAKAIIDYSATSQKSTELTMEEQVSRALQKAFDQDKLYKNIDPAFSKDFERLTNEVIANYRKRNIGLLDFLDFYDSYKQNTIQINSILFNRISAFEDLNFYTGSNFFN